MWSGGQNNLLTLAASEDGYRARSGCRRELCFSLGALGFAFFGICECTHMYHLLQEKQVLNSLYSVQ